MMHTSIALNEFRKRWHHNFPIGGRDWRVQNVESRQTQCSAIYNGNGNVELLGTALPLVARAKRLRWTNSSTAECILWMETINGNSKSTIAAAAKFHGIRVGKHLYLVKRNEMNKQFITLKGHFSSPQSCLHISVDLIFRADNFFSSPLIGPGESNSSVVYSNIDG